MRTDRRAWPQYISRRLLITRNVSLITLLPSCTPSLLLTADTIMHSLSSSEIINLLERPQSRPTEPLLLIYSFQLRSAFRATTTPSQPRALDTVACVVHAQTAAYKAPI